ncbi:A/G-specific adenine glycosylase [Apibacter raozihei]|uniref:A/G-specific adenine glycosylase n=1 Tax=Apibacter TaxID=1778601 RepID=UPI000FE376A0|nr:MULTISPECIES: A/G-specific adenine glycosylase [Apibacter]
MNFIKLLENWYKINKRDLPWRETLDPYNIWISEIIFQQTRINQGYNYYLNFISKFPTLDNLAKATEDEVLQSWQGLGYYSRAHNLHFSAKYICSELRGRFPSTFADILTLKGVGKYTAAAIASISFHEKVPAIDGNAFRVYSRLFNCNKDISKASTFTYFFNLMTPLMPENPGDFNQAIMDLGSLICTPTNPSCPKCPVQTECLAHKNNTQSTLPVKTSTLKIKDESIHYAYFNCAGKFLLKKRDNKSIWKGLYEFPLFIDEYKKEYEIINTEKLHHKLSHRNLSISISEFSIKEKALYDIANKIQAIVLTKKELKSYAMPKPLEIFLQYN